ncbi:membrane protein DedA with SNARE-associated domain [Saccharopolyspora lacisalsi]|uniref:Membrane protein DedA with SNARE-associated domain n=1 Tax=Halosaccharopolyspora lacisalsi TaxID=1000566 RepID=A0A839E209_9PSEU|nr:DedA family protein [Halosaccharopolyspora lacisalsi]MBA8826586.1 membrane protein DedA with SNARE-associated domain [Halosaccharopolyspora lacisalsi]
MDSTTLAAAPAEPTGFAGWAIGFMEALGAPGAGTIIALENLFPPVPSEVILPLAGVVAGRGEMSVLGAILWTTLGSLVGALVLYYLGAWLGNERMRAIAARMPLIKLSDVDRTEAWFAEHGVKAVFFGRMVPLFRSFISLPAGVERMSLTTFVMFTTLGSLIWNSAFVLAGYALGSNWHLVEHYAGFFSKAVLVAVVLAVVYFVVSRLKQRREGDQELLEDDWPTQELEAVTQPFDAPTQEIRRVR